MAMSVADAGPVGLLSGGHASEHEISLRTGATMRAAMESSGCEVVEMVIGTDGVWNELARGLSQRSMRVDNECSAAVWRGDALEAVARWKQRGVRCVALGLHGRGGEDGAIQGFLEVSGLAYTGCGVGASAVALDKILTKHLMRSADIPTPRWSVVQCAGGRTSAAVAEIVTTHGLPVVVKAVGLGSSVGVFVCKDASAVADALHKLSTEAQVLVEDCVRGREFSVPVLGHGLNARALPAISIVPKLGDFFDLASKYTPGGAEEVCPAQVDATTAAALAAASVALHRLIGARGVTRTDIMQHADGSIAVLEINTLPGMTAESLVPRSAAVAGYSMAALMELLIQDGLDARAARCG